MQHLDAVAGEHRRESFRSRGRGADERRDGRSRTVSVRSGAALAAALVGACALIALRASRTMGDYEHELLPAAARPARRRRQRVRRSRRRSTARASGRALPFAWLADALGAGDLGVYRAGALRLPAAARRR